MHTCEEVGVDNVVSGIFDQRFLVGSVSIGFFRGDEAGADIGKVGTQRQRGGNGETITNSARQQDCAIKPFFYFAHERERRKRPGMTTGTGAHQDEAINTLFRRFFGMLHIDDVMEDKPAIRMRRFNNLCRWAQRGDDNRHLVLHTDLHIVHQPVVGCMADLVDSERSYFLVRVGSLIFGKLGFNPDNPLLKHRLGAGVQRWKRPDNPGFALCNDKLRAGHNKQG